MKQLNQALMIDRHPWPQLRNSLALDSKTHEGLYLNFLLETKLFLKTTTIIKYSDRKRFKYNNTHKSRHRLFNTSMSTYVHSQLIA